MTSHYNKELNNLEKTLNYKFSKQKLLLNAITHSSYANEKKNNLSDNERLEFLGDAVLKLAVSEFLFNKHQEFSEGAMTKIRALIISDQILAKEATRINLGSFMRLSRNEIKNGGKTRSSILANAMEAIFGAVYLDGGLEKAKKVIISILEKDLNNITPATCLDYKSSLQEIIQKNSKKTPKYKLVKEVGPDHNKTFIIQNTIIYNKKEISSFGRGRTKKQAEQNAARKTLNKIK